MTQRAEVSHHTTIASEYWKLYAEFVFTRANAYRAESERSMRECMSNREEYDLDGVRAVVAHWGRRQPNGHEHRVAQSILAERLAEIEKPTFDIAFADEHQLGEIQRIEKRNADAVTMGQLISLRDKWKKEGEDELHAQVLVLINDWAAVMLAK